MNKELKRIIGGIDVKHDSVMIGGAEIIVGENVQWMTRNKLLTFENEIKYDINIRRLIKIIGLKIPVGTNNKVYYDTEQLPVLSNRDLANAIHTKAITVLKERIKIDVDTVIDRLIIEYELREPFYMALYNSIRCLAYINKTNNPSSYRIKVNASLASRFEFREKYYFKFSNISNINSAKELFLHMLSLVESSDKKDKQYTCPILTDVKYPTFDKTEYERKKLNEINKLTGSNSVKDYVFAILLMENMLTTYLNEIELYYVVCAKNISLMSDTLYKYFNITTIL